MKFQRTLSQPNVLILRDCPSEQSWVERAWKRFTNQVSLASIWTSFLNYAAGLSEPTLRKRDRNGQTDYNIYDPTTEQRSGWLSEDEARAWLEQRYYQ